MPSTATQYSPATIKRCRTILRNADKPVTATRQTRATKAVRKAQGDWRTERPTNGQIKRNRDRLATIHKLEATLGYALSTHAMLRPDGKPAPFTGQGYSDHLAILNAHRDSLLAELNG